MSVNKHLSMAPVRVTDNQSETLLDAFWEAVVSAAAYHLKLEARARGERPEGGLR
jgi:hypothetical protein